MRRSIRAFAVLALLLALAAGGIWLWQGSQTDCCADPGDPGIDPPEIDAAFKQELGLMTSLPLYWPLGTGLSDLASGDVEAPWQRAALEHNHELVLLDTLSPIPGLGANDPETDPLEGLERLAVIQPRGLSPADNAALDEWVRAGGQLLLVLDPMLTGEYDLPLGDPRRPVDVALVPPVLGQWGLSFSAALYEVWENGFSEIPLAGEVLPVGLPGYISITESNASDCELLGSDVIARCAVGEGQVILMTDAAIFEGSAAHSHGLDAEIHDHDEDESNAENARSIQILLNFSFG